MNTNIAFQPKFNYYFEFQIEVFYWNNTHYKLKLYEVNWSFNFSVLARKKTRTVSICLRIAGDVIAKLY